MINPQQQLQLQYDGRVNIAVGKSRKETKWKNQEMSWSDVVNKLSTTTRTRETMAQYLKLSRDERSDIKDVGGFVGGVVKEGRRKAGNVAWRSLLTLDADFADGRFWSFVDQLFPFSMVLYSTHSHTPERPKLRLVMPFSRQVQPDEYEAISRFIAADIGIDIFDDTTYQPERLMYWPSTAEDGEFLFRYKDGPFLDPDAILSTKPLWRDATTWPESSRAHQRRLKHAEKQGDPREKPGLIGAFCRTYSIHDAVSEFLPDIYVPCDKPNRFTYAEGSTSAGIIVYEDDLFSFSHHGTDPAGGVLCNAFDLVRIHKFGIRDDDTKMDTAVNKLPSYKAMNDFAGSMDKVKIELANAKQQEVMDEFGDSLQQIPPAAAVIPGAEVGQAAPMDFTKASAEDPNLWKTKLKYGEKGSLLQSIHNAVLILRNDPVLKGIIAYDEFNRKICIHRSAPWKSIEEPEAWTDSDDAALRHYLEIAYSLNKKTCIDDALAIVMMEQKFHPVRDYLDSLTWDGVPRIETALIDYMEADDNIYTREVSRKWFTAGAGRMRKPGLKFDYMIILVGSQGIGKSTYFNRLARNPLWFSDSMSKFDNSKDAMESLAGKWIVELGELSAMKKYEVEHVKVFLSKQIDSYRVSYGRRQEDFPRQCLFGGTTNREDFLQDATGARRFWPVKVNSAAGMWSRMTPAVVDQLWAEADFNYMMGEQLWLGKDAGRIAKEVQEEYTELGGKVGPAGEFLDRKVPYDWKSMSIAARMDFIHGNEFSDEKKEGSILRDEVAGIELFVECFGGRIDTYSKRDSYEMNDVLRSLGWSQGKARKVSEYGKQRIWVRPRLID